MDYYDRVGIAALGSRLRRLGDRLAEDSARVYEAYGTSIQPRWFPVLFLLTEKGALSVTAIADEIGHTHASVSQIAKELAKHGFIATERGKEDGRKNFVRLTRKGAAAMNRFLEQFGDVKQAVEVSFGAPALALWNALAAFEQALGTSSLFDRVQRVRQARLGAASIRVVDYHPRYARAFKELNEAWITRYFTLEEPDRQALDTPQATILDPGGAILIALDGDTPVGTAALMPHGPRCFELVKMAVDPARQGKGIGHLLGTRALAKAKELGATRVYLESNRKLAPAISLYRKLGFHEVDGGRSPYARADIQMEASLT